MAKNYSKTHKSEKAANNHEKKIKEKGGKVVKTKVSGGIKLDYSFPSKK
jgi:hypothetical protein